MGCEEFLVLFIALDPEDGSGRGRLISSPFLQIGRDAINSLLYHVYGMGSPDSVGNQGRFHINFP